MDGENRLHELEIGSGERYPITQTSPDHRRPMHNVGSIIHYSALEQSNWEAIKVIVEVRESIVTCPG